MWTWGDDAFGELGDGTPGLETLVPTLVHGLPAIKAIGIGLHHSLAVDSEGSVWAWGDNQHGELGEGSKSPAESLPVRVRSLTQVVSAAGGDFFSLALKSDGTVWAWGCPLSSGPRPWRCRC